MNNTWKYVVELTDEDAIQKVESVTDVKAPEGFEKFIRMTNGGSPTKKLVNIGNSEKVIGAVLSFNKNDKNTEDVYLALKILNRKNLIPFAIDPFGNFFCYSGESQTVVFWNHEDDALVDSEMSFKVFINSLH